MQHLLSHRTVKPALIGSALALSLGAAAPGQAKELVLGAQCDRSGPTQNVGAYICDGLHDFVKLANKQKWFGDHTLRVFEIDHGYEVPRGVEAYERTKEAGHISYAIYGTPHTYALTPRLTEDQVPGTSPGFGSAAAANGEAYPYIFPIAATYWSQAGAAMKFVMDQWKEAGNEGTPKIAYLFYDNPAGREPLEVFHALRDELGFEWREFAVPPPGVEMRPQVLDIARRYKADWVITHLFGKGPGVSIKELSRMRFPIDHVISFVWGGGESDLNVAGWDVGEGYYALQFAGVGEDHQVVRDVVKMYEDEGLPKPEELKQSVYYNRGLLIGAVHSKAIANAVEAKGANVTGDDVRKGFERIANFDLEGFLPPLNITPQDHEGGGWTQVWQVRNGQWVRVTDWFQGYRDVVMDFVSKAEPPKTN